MLRKLIALSLILLMSINCNAQNKRYHGDGIDEVLQYTPLAAAYVLKAAGVKGEHKWNKFIVSSATSFVINAGVTYGLKHVIKSTRPDGTDNHSFPSGHTSIAFNGAMVLHKEFGKKYPLISVAGFSIAAVTAYDRVRRNRHHTGDVLAGAAIGILSAEAGYWIGDKIMGKKKNVDVAVMPSGIQVIVGL
ncbi:MAG: phosphatase PAP2 family protein [Prevotellaceae bacterium]|nr:phosphatase PAP2 family protein [Prevotellaceae bacterium]